MKFSFFLTIILISFFTVNAQQPCGTPLTDEMKARLIEYSLHKSDYEGSNSDRVMRFVPIKFHIVGKTNGSGHYLLADIWPLLCELNTKYAPAGFYFYLFGDVHYIDNDEYFDHDFNSGDQMMNDNNVSDVANIYIVDDPAGYCGYYTYGQDAISVAKSCNAPGSTTLAHELGHYFSLPHPFDIVGSQKEYVNGSNCSFAGDMFCDTRADFLDYRWSCPFTGSDTDPNGDVYDPDETLFMSYSYDNCQNNFSNEQIAAMNYNLTFQRADLLNHPPPDITPITGVEQLTYPIDSVNNIPHDFVEFKWQPVTGADYYHLQVTRAPTFAGEPTDMDMLIHGTAITTALDPDKKYHWRVLPLKDGYTCTTWSPTETFFTVLGTGLNETVYPEENFAIYPTLFKAGNQLSISLNAMKSGNAVVSFISPNGIVLTEMTANLVAGENNWKISTEQFSSGMYLINIRSEGNIYQQKVIVMQ
ncbi:MAG: T9SS type A sorting domain-containing protein [Chitinophagales bacterium]